MKEIRDIEMMTKLGSEIKKEMKRQKLTQRKLCYLSGLHKNCVSKVLQGQTCSTHITIMRILLVLDVNFNKFFKEVYLS